MIARRWGAVILGGLALSAAGRLARAEEPIPDAQMLLDLDLLHETNVARDRALFRRFRLLETMRMLEALKLLESSTQLPPRDREPSPGATPPGKEGGSP